MDWLGVGIVGMIWSLFVAVAVITLMDYLNDKRGKPPPPAVPVTTAPVARVPQPNMVTEERLHEALKAFFRKSEQCADLSVRLRRAEAKLEECHAKREG